MSVSRQRRMPDPAGGAFLPESDLVYALSWGAAGHYLWAFTRQFEEEFVAVLAAMGGAKLGLHTLEDYLRYADAEFKKRGAVDYTPALRDTVQLYVRYEGEREVTKDVTILGGRVILNRDVGGSSSTSSLQFQRAGAGHRIVVPLQIGYGLTRFVP